MAADKAVMAVIKAARPAFRNAHDRSVFAVHAAFLAAGYSLAAAGAAAFSDHLPSGEEEVGIEGWNELEDRYGFLYFKEEKGTKIRVLLKALIIGDILAIDVVNLETEQSEPLHIKINVKDYMNGGEKERKNYGEMYKNLNGLVESVNSTFLNKLEGVRENTFPSTGRDTAASSSWSYEGEGVSNAQPVVGIPINEPEGIVYPPIMPPDYNDAFPGPGAGFYPDRGMRGGGDMLVGPNDPRFFPSGARPSGIPGGLGGIPPGSRYDPIGPLDVPGFEPSRFIRGSRRPDGSSTHPDLQFFRRDPADFI